MNNTEKMITNISSFGLAYEKKSDSLVCITVSKYEQERLSQNKIHFSVHRMLKYQQLGFYNGCMINVLGSPMKSHLEFVFDNPRLAESFFMGWEMKPDDFGDGWVYKSDDFASQFAQVASSNLYKNFRRMFELEKQ